MAKVSVPGGISAIFEPFIRKNPFLSGARGAGIGIKNAVKVTVEIRPSDSLEVENIINGESVEGGIGYEAVKTFFEVLEMPPKYRVMITQKISIPIAAGFGTSAASALGIVLGLAKELDIPLSIVEAGDIAHIAEIRAGTGLGTVTGLVYLGDIVIVSQPGAPSIGRVDRIPLKAPDIVLVVASRGKRETAKALAEKDFLEKAKIYGSVAMDKLTKRPTIQTFFEVANWFASNIGVMTKRISSVIDKLEPHVIGVAQAMIGDSIFALVYRDEVDEVLNIISDEWKVPGIVGVPVSTDVYYFE